MTDVAGPVPPAVEVAAQTQPHHQPCVRLRWCPTVQCSQEPHTEGLLLSLLPSRGSEARSRRSRPRGTEAVRGHGAGSTSADWRLAQPREVKAEGQKIRTSLHFPSSAQQGTGDTGPSTGRRRNLEEPILTIKEAASVSSFKSLSGFLWSPKLPRAGPLPVPASAPATQTSLVSNCHRALHLLLPLPGMLLRALCTLSPYPYTQLRCPCIRAAVELVALIYVFSLF